MCDETRFGYSTLIYIVFTNLFLSFYGLRLINFALVRFYSFLSSYMFILLVVLLQVTVVGSLLSINAKVNPCILSFILVPFREKVPEENPQTDSDESSGACEE